MSTTLGRRNGGEHARTRRASTTARILRYELRDLVRSRWLVGYLLFFLVFSEGLYRAEGSSLKVLLNLIDVVLLLIPLASAVFGTIYLYSAREFVELLLSQPVSRRQLFSGLYLGLALALSTAFVAGAAEGPAAPAAPFDADAGGCAAAFAVSWRAGAAATCAVGDPGRGGKPPSWRASAMLESIEPASGESGGMVAFVFSQ